VHSAFRTGIFVLFCCLCLPCLAQGPGKLLQTPLHLPLQHAPLRTVLAAIQETAQISLAYAAHNLKLEREVHFTGQEKTIGDHLQTALTGEYVRIVERRGRIILAQSRLPLKSSTAQKISKYTLSGHVIEEGSGEALVGAAIYNPRSGQGTYANEYGFFSLTLPKGEHEIVFQSVGYEAKVFAVNFNASLRMEVELISDLEVETVEIQVDEKSELHNLNTIGRHTLSMDKEGSIPVLLGEADVLKTMQLLPGVHGGTDIGAGFYVRGGGQDQNLVHLDGVPVYNVNHLLGIVSVFNSSAINSASITKGSFPARYPGRLSSLVDIRMKEGNKEHWAGEIGVGLLSGKIGLEGPIIKEKASFFISARRTWLDLLYRTVAAIADGTPAGYNFNDLNAKVNWQASRNDRIFLSGYTGKDLFQVKNFLYRAGSNEASDQTKAGWGNRIGALRWNHLFNQKLFSNTTLTYSQYRFFLKQNALQTQDTTWYSLLEFDSESKIEDFSGRIDFDYFPNPDHVVKFGFGNTYHVFSPATTDNRQVFGGIDTSFSQSSGTYYSHEASAFLEDDFRVNAQLRVNLGIQMAGFFPKEKTYWGLQPRFSARYLINENQSLKLSGGRMMQFVHLLVTSGAGIPVDLWVPSTGVIEPSRSDQVSLGYYRSWGDRFQFRSEIFYKKMYNLLEYREGFNLLNNSYEWETSLEVGEGRSYGAEFMLEKTAGDLTGWVSYAWSKSDRMFANLNFGRPFPFRYDRRHDTSLALNYRLNDKVSFGAVWTYGSGNAITLGDTRYGALPNINSFSPNGSQIISSGERNNFRAPAFHRLDLSINLDKELQRGQRRWSFGLYNAYNRVNPSFIYTRRKDNGSVGVFKQGLLPIVPLVNYQFKF